MRAKLIKNIGLANYCFQEAMATPRINKKSTPFVLKGMDNICSFKASPHEEKQGLAPYCFNYFTLPCLQ
jgi:hypothetical protein